VSGPPGEQDEERAPKVNPAAAVGLGLLAVVLGGAVAFGLLRKPAEPPPASIARDPLLVAGRLVFLDRCVSCHGASGKGDGPISKGLAGPPVGDLSDATWKHGDQPEHVLAVIDKGVTGTAMPGWGRTFNAGELRAVAAYVYYLAGREVPVALRER